MFYGRWDSYDEMKGDWFPNRRASPVPEDFPSENDLVFALYGGGSYDGEAVVVYVREDGQLMEVHGSHCSCYGLENQWNPEETSKEALELRNLRYLELDPEELAAVKQLIAEL